MSTIPGGGKKGKGYYPVLGIGSKEVPGTAPLENAILLDRFPQAAQHFPQECSVPGQVAVIQRLCHQWGGRGGISRVLRPPGIQHRAHSTDLPTRRAALPLHV